jgi:hypothetical protein
LDQREAGTDVASIEKRIRDGDLSWVARSRDPDERQRKRSFPRKVDAERFLTGVESDKLRGAYVDPDAGRVLVKAYADQWLAGQTFDPNTRQAVELRLRRHAHPALGKDQLRQIKPSTVQAWLRGLEDLAPAYRRVIFANVSSIFAAAVDDELLAKSPCHAASVKAPRVDAPKVIPCRSIRCSPCATRSPSGTRSSPRWGPVWGCAKGKCSASPPATSTSSAAASRCAARSS